MYTGTCKGQIRSLCVLTEKQDLWWDALCCLQSSKSNDKLKDQWFVCSTQLLGSSHVCVMDFSLQNNMAVRGLFLCENCLWSSSPGLAVYGEDYCRVTSAYTNSGNISFEGLWRSVWWSLHHKLFLVFVLILCKSSLYFWKWHDYGCHSGAENTNFDWMVFYMIFHWYKVGGDNLLFHSVKLHRDPQSKDCDPWQKIDH